MIEDYITRLDRVGIVWITGELGGYLWPTLR